MLKCVTALPRDHEQMGTYSTNTRSLMDVIWKRKKSWIGYILRGESLLREVIDRLIGKRPRGRKRLGMLNEFLKESSYAELKRKARSKKEWRIWKPRACLEAEH